MIRKLTGITLAAGALILGACHEDESLAAPPPPPPGSSVNALFDRPVWMGNSITAGFQSNGINDSTQRQSYAYLLANAMGTPYFYRQLRGFGCQGPYTNNKTQARVGGTEGLKCGGASTAVLPWMSNTAVPGARAIEMTNNNASPSASNTLTQVILEFATQAERMTEADPTFVSMWAGNNDVLGALTNSSNPGLPAAITSQVNFDAAYDAAANAIAASTATGVILMGVVDVSNIPYTSKGATIWCLRMGVCPGVPKALPDSFIVNNNCAPNAAVPGAKGDSILVPWTKYLPLIGSLNGTNHATLDCSVDAVVVTPAEYAALRNAVVGFNAKIQAVATANNWAFWNPNGALDSLRLAGQIPPFPNIASANVDFGPWISLDGVHPSAAAHKLIANYMRGVINTKYATTIPAIP